ncbi:helix-turn-helix domain-containing protein [Tabrizicola sp. YIM 78059]|uniref:helix-turn-helix domain-containing protein n=1 Tax=Tabrizicola sp. YIM 78059 TaxID=2529861 RepID=UPI0010AB4E2A|nr:helix-turn-helix domain-containing protein [Tabrizicola sp. YIM 78059]
MPLSTLTGTRLRERRLAAGLRQADVAEAAGISASYLNLIEHNRRKVSPELIDRLAGILGLDRAALAGGEDAALVEDLRAAASRATPTLAELDRAEELVSRFPGWAELLVALDRRVQMLERAVEALNDRMSHDPHLSQALHEVLSSLSSVRATAAILAETEDLDPQWASRFHRNLHHDSERLAAGAEALVAYLDAGSGIAEQGIASPQEEVEDWLNRRGWIFTDAELASGCRDDVAALASTAARSLAQRLLAGAAADARALPETAFAAALAVTGPDPLSLADRFGADPLTVMRRLALRSDVAAGLVICDGSGTLTFRKPASGFPLPRFGAACPLWPLYTALGRPGQPVEVLVSIAGQGGRTFRTVAWGQMQHPQGLRGPELRAAAMLILPAEPGAGAALPVGSSCRVCARAECPARREPSILSLAL